MRQPQERTISEDDLDFLEMFEQCSLGKQCWTHEAHIRMAWLQMERSSSFDEALERIRKGIMTFNSSVQSVGYHETITIAFARLIHSMRQERTTQGDWRDFLKHHADLLSKDCLLEYYTADVLASDEARQRFVEPNRKQLPDFSLE